MYSNKLLAGRDFFFCPLLFPVVSPVGLEQCWYTEGLNKHLLNKWMEYILSPKSLQRIKTLISIVLSLFKLFYGRNFSLGISFETTSTFLQSHFNFWIKSMHTEWVYLCYISGMDPNNFLTLFSKGEFTILEVIKRTPQVLKAILWEAYQNVCINKTSLEKVSNFLRWIPWRE